MAKPSFEELEKELREIKSSLKEGSAAADSRDLERAEHFFGRALELLRKTFPNEHPDVILCLQNVADVSYSLHKYPQAVKLYQELLSIGADPKASIEQRDLIITKFKLARSFDKSGRRAEAEKSYQQAREDAQRHLSPGHPLLSTILEGYAGYLRRTQKNPSLINELEDLARANRLAGADTNALSESILASLQDDADVKPTKAPRRGRLRFRGVAGAGAEIAQIYHGIISKSVRLSIAALTVAFVLAAGLQFKNSFIKAMHNDTENAASAAYAGKTFVTADGRGALSFTTLHHIDLIFDGKSIDKTFHCVGTEECERYRSKYLIENSRGILKDSQGTTFYAATAPEPFVGNRMLMVMQEAQKYYKVKGKFPNDIAALQVSEAKLLYKNPVTDKLDSPVLTEVSLKQPIADFADNCRAGERWSGEPAIPAVPCSIHCCVATADPGRAQVFVARGFDREGNPLSGSDGDLFVLISENGAGESAIELTKREKTLANQEIVICEKR